VCRAATVLGFAPFYLFPLPVATLVLLIVLWRRAAGRREAMLTGFCLRSRLFSRRRQLGLRQSARLWRHAGAAGRRHHAAVLLLSGALPAAIGWIYHALGARSTSATLIVLPALWTLADWLRGWLFTGFPWIALGYSQVPASRLPATHR